MKNLTIKTQRWIYFGVMMNRRFVIECAAECTRRNYSLADSASIESMMEADAYLMGGEL